MIVTDAFLSGDLFTVFDGDRVLGVTSGPVGGRQIGSDCGAALEDASFSRGALFLAPGSHQIRIQTVASAPGSTSGRGCIRTATISKELCQGAGWKRYGVFRNQGDCVSFVATDGRNGASTGR